MLVFTTKPTCMIATYSRVHSAMPPTGASSSRRKSKRGRKRKPTFRSDGHIATVCTTMPRVVPPASRMIWLSVMLAGVAPGPATSRNAPPTTMTTRLLMTGVHIGAAKLPRAFSEAPASAPTP